MLLRARRCCQGYPSLGPLNTNTVTSVLDCETPVRLTVLHGPASHGPCLSTGVPPKRVIELPSQVRSAAKSAPGGLLSGGAAAEPWRRRPPCRPHQMILVNGPGSIAHRSPCGKNRHNDSRYRDRGAFPKTAGDFRGLALLKINLVSILGFWVEVGAAGRCAEYERHLAWALQGGDRLVLPIGRRA